jgi:hypothetical protein
VEEVWITCGEVGEKMCSKPNNLFTALPSQNTKVYVENIPSPRRNPSTNLSTGVWITFLHKTDGFAAFKFPF